MIPVLVKKQGHSLSQYALGTLAVILGFISASPYWGQSTPKTEENLVNIQYFDTKQDDTELAAITQHLIQYAVTLPEEITIVASVPQSDALFETLGPYSETLAVSLSVQRLVAELQAKMPTNPMIADLITWASLLQAKGHLQKQLDQNNGRQVLEQLPGNSSQRYSSPTNLSASFETLTTRSNLRLSYLAEHQPQQYLELTGLSKPKQRLSEFLQTPFFQNIPAPEKVTLAGEWISSRLEAQGSHLAAVIKQLNATQEHATLQTTQLQAQLHNKPLSSSVLKQIQSKQPWILNQRQENNDTKRLNNHTGSKTH